MNFLLSFISGFFLGQAVYILQRLTNKPSSNPSSLGFDGISLFIISSFCFFSIDNPLLIFSLHLVLSPLFFKKSFISHQKSLVTNLFLGSTLILLHYFSMELGNPFPQKILFGKTPSLTLPYSISFFLISFFLLITSIKKSHSLSILTLGSHIHKNLKSLSFEKHISFFYFFSFIMYSFIISFCGFFSFFTMTLGFFSSSFSFFSFSCFSGLLLLFAEIISILLSSWIFIPSSLIASFLSSIFLFFMYSSIKKES
jgi:ABC-type Fe3+-siderophore transport system permease subunit